MSDEKRKECTPEERQAWDQYVAGYLAGRTGVAGVSLVSDNAAKAADELLARRRERFG